MLLNWHLCLLLNQDKLNSLVNWLLNTFGNNITKIKLTKTVTITSGLGNSPRDEWKDHSPAANVLSSVASCFFCPRLPWLLIPRVIVLAATTVDHQHTVSPVFKHASVGIAGYGLSQSGVQTCSMTPVELNQANSSQPEGPTGSTGNWAN